MPNDRMRAAMRIGKPNDPPPVIDWAIEHARASLRVGVSVPEIESRLVARGLDPILAEAAVTHALSDRIREPSEAEKTSRRFYQTAAIVAGAGSVLLAFCTDGVLSAAWTLILVMVILACLWFAHRVGVGLGMRGKVLVRFMATIVLIFLLVYRLMIQLH